MRLSRHSSGSTIFAMNKLTASLACAVLALATSGCISTPQELDTRLTRNTVEGKYVVTLVPPPAPAAINALHPWQVRVATANGAPVTRAHITVDGGMPQHGHGLPTQPLVRRELSDGTYLLEGMKFSMTGWWEIKLAVDAANGIDKVTFNTVVNDRPAR